jgi:hypothetical protein
LWLLLAEMGLIVVFALALAAAGVWWWPVMLEMAFGLMVALLLAAALFMGRTQIPFTRPRLPGRKALPAMMVTYAAVFPALVLASMQLELTAERRLGVLGWAAMVVAGTLLLMHGMDLLACRGIIGGFPEDEEDDGPLRLGLS